MFVQFIFSSLVLEKNEAQGITITIIMESYVKKICQSWPVTVTGNGMLEVELGTVVDGMESFREFIQRMEKVTKQSVSQPVRMLTVSNGKNGRVRLTGVSDIQNYIKTGRFPPQAVFQEKTRLGVVRLTGNIRLKFNNEQPSTSQNFQRNTTNFTFRYATRYTIKSGNLVQLDFTVVKEASGHTFSSANVMQRPERYEVELELLTPTLEAFEAARLQLEPVIEEFMRLRCGDLSIVDEEDRIGREKGFSKLYLTNVPDMERHRAMSNYPCLFPSIKAMDMQLYKENVKGNEESYLVTDKLDGQRSLLYVDTGGSITFVQKAVRKTKSARFETTLHFMPSLEQLEDVSNAIYDGELIWLEEHQLYVFFTFDVVYHDGMYYGFRPFDSVRYPLVKELSHRSKRLWIVPKLFVPMKEMHLLLLLPLNVQINNDQCEMSRSFNMINGQPQRLTLDGLVLQPKTSAYPFYTKNWPLCFKWKPGFSTTMDFQVLSIPKTMPAVLLKKGNESYKRVKFGLTGSSEEFHGCLFIDPKSGQVRTLESKHVVKERMIVECQLVSFGDEQLWVPLLVRYDKSKPNAIRTYHATMNSIRDPITLDMLKQTGSQLVEFAEEVSSTFMHTKLVEECRRRQKRFLRVVVVSDEGFTIEPIENVEIVSLANTIDLLNPTSMKALLSYGGVDIVWFQSCRLVNDGFKSKSSFTTLLRNISTLLCVDGICIGRYFSSAGMHQGVWEVSAPRKGSVFERSLSVYINERKMVTYLGDVPNNTVYRCLSQQGLESTSTQTMECFRQKAGIPLDNLTLEDMEWLKLQTLVVFRKTSTARLSPKRSYKEVTDPRSVEEQEVDDSLTFRPISPVYNPNSPTYTYDPDYRAPPSPHYIPSSPVEVLKMRAMKLMTNDKEYNPESPPFTDVKKKKVVVVKKKKVVVVKKK